MCREKGIEQYGKCRHRESELLYLITADDAAPVKPTQEYVLRESALIVSERKAHILPDPVVPTVRAEGPRANLKRLLDNVRHGETNGTRAS
jgi:hypothetical protein